MKKSFFLSILAVGALVAGCAKSEIVDTKFNEEISFETYLGRDAQTKGSIIQKNDLTSVTVYGYYTGSATYTSGTTANLWENGITLAVNEGTVSQPTGNDIRYWANATDNYTFLAYAPTDKSVLAKPTSSTDPTLVYTVPNILADQIDVLSAKIIDGTKTEDFTDGVTLNMQHALSRVTVKASATSEKFKFDIKEVTLSGTFVNSGSLPLNEGVWESTSSADVTYSFYANNKTVTGEGDSQKITYGAYNAANALSATPKDYSGTTVAEDVTTYGNNYLMILPQNTTGGNIEINVAYTTYYMEAESGVINKSFPVEIDFQPGKAYVLNLTFTHEEKPIEFKVEVANWDEATTGSDNTING